MRLRFSSDADIVRLTNARIIIIIIIGGDSTRANGNSAPILSEEPGANVTFCLGTFQGLVFICEVKVQ